MTSGSIIGIVAVGIVCMLLGTWVGYPAGRAGLAATLGLLLGPFGVLIAALLRPTAAAAAAFESERAGLSHVTSARPRADPAFGSPSAGAVPSSDADAFAAAANASRSSRAPPSDR